MHLLLDHCEMFPKFWQLTVTENSSLAQWVLASELFIKVIKLDRKQINSTCQNWTNKPTQRKWRFRFFVREVWTHHGMLPILQQWTAAVQQQHVNSRRQTCLLKYRTILFRRGVRQNWSMFWTAQKPVVQVNLHQYADLHVIQLQCYEIDM